MEDWPKLRHLLEDYKREFMLMDLKNTNTLDLWELGRLLERLGQPKTHVELKEMMSKVDREKTGQISYNDFLFLMLGKSNSVLHLTVKFEELTQKEKEKVPIKRLYTPRRREAIRKVHPPTTRSLSGWKQTLDGKWVPHCPELVYPK